MKLTGIHVEDYGPQSSPKTIRLCEGLNVVVDPNANDNALGRMFGDTVFGASGAGNRGPESKSTDSAGWIEVTSEGLSYRLSRRFLDRRNPLIVMPVDPSTRPNSLDALRKLDQEIFETFFNCDLTDRRTLSSMTQWLCARSGSAGGTAPAPVVDRQENQNRSDANTQRREDWAQQNATLSATQVRLRRELDARASRFQTEGTLLQESLSDLAQQIEQCNVRIRLANARRDLLDRQIIEWERQPDLAVTGTPAVPSAGPANVLTRLYDRLDEIDCQWRSWREVQQGIQKRRVGIRDELASASDAIVGSLDRARQRWRELVQSLETKIAQIEPWATRRTEPKPSTEAPLATETCPAMRQALRDLSKMLEQQDHQLRHRTAAAELKQLRNCYNELENGVNVLVRRRHSIIEQIHALDPEGAEIVLQGNQHFCTMAQRDGYWRAREQCVRPIRSAPTAREPSQELGTDRWQLDSAKQQRTRVHEQLAQENSELRVLVNQRDVIADRLCRHLAEDRDIRVQLERVDSALQRDSAQSNPPHLGKNPARPLPAQILEYASFCLRQLSDGQWTRVDLTENAAALVVGHAQGHPMDAGQLDRTIQAQIALSLCLSAARFCGSRGMHVPLFLSEPQVILGVRGRRSLVELVGDLVVNGLQLILVVRQANDAAAFAALRPNVVDIASSQQAPRYAIPSLALADSHTFRERTSSRDTNRQGPTFERRSTNDQESQIAAEPIFRFPIQRSLHWSAPIAETAQPAEAHDSQVSAALSSASRLRDTAVCTFAEWSALERVGVTTIGKLLEANPESLAVTLAGQRVLAAQVQRWQACCWMLICVPGMAAEDALVLHECGITAPQQLEEVRGELLLRKLHSHFTANGRGTAFARYNVERINSWMRSLARTRPNWKQLDLWQRSANTIQRVSPSPSTQPLPLAPTSLPMDSRAVSHFAVSSAAPQELSTENSRESLRFHLQLNDSVDAAPSISSRICQQLAQMGVRTVRDFLSRAPDDMARAMNNRRITTETVRQWQQQARIACSVPNLRRHDAQILVACGIGDPEQLASMNPSQLFERVDQFVRSKAGMRLVRSGKKPDLAEATDWIRWAQHTRSVQAA